MIELQTHHHRYCLITFHGPLRTPHEAGSNAKIEEWFTTNLAKSAKEPYNVNYEEGEQSSESDAFVGMSSDIDEEGEPDPEDVQNAADYEIHQHQFNDEDINFDADDEDADDSDDDPKESIPFQDVFALLLFQLSKVVCLVIDDRMRSLASTVTDFSVMSSYVTEMQQEQKSLQAQLNALQQEQRPLQTPSFPGASSNQEDMFDVHDEEAMPENQIALFLKNLAMTDRPQVKSYKPDLFKNFEELFMAQQPQQQQRQQANPPQQNQPRQDQPPAPPNPNEDPIIEDPSSDSDASGLEKKKKKKVRVRDGSNMDTHDLPYKREKCLVRTIPEGFGIDRLWPDNSNRRSGQPNPKILLYAIPLGDLYDEMMREWLDVKNDPDDQEFWEHEWDFHGTISNNMYNQGQYFELAVEFVKQFPVRVWLIQKNIYANDGVLEYNAQDISLAISAQTLKEPKLRCEMNLSSRLDLKEIMMDLAGSVIDCSRPSKNCFKKDISFLL
ncbi:hypothetical protein LguiB_028306 [Lonicera macranthoides]